MSSSVFRKINELLSQQERKDAAWLMVFVTVMAFLELLGVAIIAPFMSLVMNPVIEKQNIYIQQVYGFLGLADMKTFLLLTGVVLVAVLWVSGMFKSYTMYRLYRFTYEREYTLSLRLFGLYMKQPYAFFLSRNTSDLGKNILSEVSVVVVGILVTGMQVLAKSMIILAILGFLLVMNPLLVAVLGGFFAVVYLTIYFVFHKKLQHMGAERHRLVEQRYSDVKEAFLAIKETKIYRYERYFLDSYARHSVEISKHSAYRDTIAQLPAYLVEAFSLTIILAALLYALLLKGVHVAELVPVVSMYAFAGYRLMPNVQQIFSGIARMRFTLPTLDMLGREFALEAREPHEAEIEKSTVPVALGGDIMFGDVSFSYADGRTVLDHIGVTIPEGKMTAVVGKTGAGKTTFIDLCLGLLAPSSGQITRGGGTISSTDTARWRRSFSYVSQNVFLFDTTIIGNMALTDDGAAVDTDRAWACLRQVCLEEFVRAQPDGLHMRVGENGNRLSGGQRQRLSIARALYRGADVMILDEATSALDPETEKEILGNILSGKNRTVVMITHRLGQLALCDRIIYLGGDGKAVEGTYADVASRHDFLNAAK